MDNTLSNNQVSLCGEIISRFKFSHQKTGENFYILQLKVERFSNTFDIIPLMLSETTLDVNEDYRGMRIRVSGQYRSYSFTKENKRRLILSVFVKDICFLENISENETENEVYLEGYLCKTPVYRETPFGRKISDLLLAINRPYGKSDYIPCITWGNNALDVVNLPAGTKIRLWGRIQSREYVKKISDTECETKTAYEVSVTKQEVLGREEDSVKTELQ